MDYWFITLHVSVRIDNHQKELTVKVIAKSIVTHDYTDVNEVQWPLNKLLHVS